MADKISFLINFLIIAFSLVFVSQFTAAAKFAGGNYCYCNGASILCCMGAGGRDCGSIASDCQVVCGGTYDCSCSDPDCTAEIGGGGSCSDFEESCSSLPCCIGLVCSTGHCCNAGQIWNASIGHCQVGSSCADYEESCSLLSCCAGHNCTAAQRCCNDGEIWNATSSKCVPAHNPGSCQCIPPPCACPNGGITRVNNCNAGFAAFCDVTGTTSCYPGCGIPTVGGCQCCVVQGNSCFASSDCCGSMACSDGHCCPTNTVWNGTGCGCNPNPPSNIDRCVESHTGGSISCACGGPCYTAMGVVNNCGQFERCHTYTGEKGFDAGPLVQICGQCISASDCCVAERGVTVVPGDCCQPPYNPPMQVAQYNSSGHCCELGTKWDGLFNVCIAANPCYFYDSLIYDVPCKFGPPNYLPRYLPNWWSSQPACIDPILRLACCYNGSGYGYSEWYISFGIIVY
jgi:hypothetical protein